MSRASRGSAVGQVNGGYRAICGLPGLSMPPLDPNTSSLTSNLLRPVAMHPPSTFGRPFDYASLIRLPFALTCFISTPLGLAVTDAFVMVSSSCLGVAPLIVASPIFDRQL